MFRPRGDLTVLKPLSLVGRAQELEQLRGRLAAAAAGEGGLVLLGGEAGIGKSALLAALLREAGAWRFATGRCPGAGETPPFGPWLEAVAGLGKEPAPLPPPFGAAGGEWTPAAMAGALAGWLGGGEQPVLLALEDLHWADPASLELLRHAAPRLERRPVLLIATYRSDELHRHHPLWSLLPELKRLGAGQLLLDRLPEAAVASLAVQALPGLAGVEGFARRLFQRTDGHPLFVTELLAAAARAGAPPPDDAPLPETIRQVIDRTLAKLSPEGGQVLAVGAIIGERFPYDLLLRAAGVSEEAAAGALEEAVALHLLRPEGEPGDTFAFAHALIREAILAGLIGPRRRRWHTAIAEALLAGPSPPVEALAYHLDRAADPRAADSLIAAGGRALRLGALAQAEAALDRALELLPEADSRRGEILIQLGWAVRWGGHARSWACFEEAERAAVAAGDHPLAVWARGRLAVAASWLGRRDALSRMARVFAEEEELLGDERFQYLAGQLSIRLNGYPPIALVWANELTGFGRLDEAQALIDQCQRRAISEIRLLESACRLAFLLGQTDEALRLAARSVDHLLQTHQYGGAAIWAQWRYTTALICRADRPADVDAAAAQMTRCESLARQFYGRYRLPEGYSVIGLHQFMRGDWEGARRNLLDSAKDRVIDGDGTVPGFAAVLLVAQGNPAGALAAMAHLEPRTPDDEMPSGDGVILLLWLKARIQMAMGELAPARAWLEAADRLAASRTLGPYLTFLHTAWAVYHRLAGDEAAAVREAEAGLAMARQMNNGWQLIELSRLLGELAAGRGAPDEAERHFQAALAMAERCQFPYELALTQVARGRALPGAPGSREGLLAARAALARLGAAPADIPAAARDAPAGLTERELEVIRLVAEGMTDREVGARLFISPRTVDRHLRNIFNKVSVGSRAALTAYAARTGII